MKITDAEWQFDKQRLTIYFTAPQRIDFRDLVKDLARIFKTRIELRQISTREETKRLGNGVGCCGLILCCNSFLHEFSHITLDHARIQQLSNNVTKLSGNCGRLKCCLLFEYQQYKTELDKYPPIGSQIILKDTNARITKIDVFKDLVFMQRADSNKIINSNLKEINEYANKGMIIYAERSDEDKYDEFLEVLEIPHED
jgi:cell fate regulator YaaT (PSP1 superfamily)